MSGGGSTQMMRIAPRPTDARGVGGALRSLWRDCCPEVAGGDVARSLTTNFVLVAAAAAEDQARAALERVYPRTPCRAFLVLVGSGGGAVDTEVAAVTRCHGTTRDIVLEEVTLRMPASKLALLPGIVRPLLVNDLPNHLYWRAEWPQDPALAEAIVDLCEHLVVDSGQSAAQTSDPDPLQQMRAQGIRVTDLTWLRLTPWRRALAEAFERILWRPGQPTRGTLRHTAGGAAGVVPLARWLETRLGAAIDLDESGSQDPDHLVLTTGDVEVCVELEHGQLAVYVTTDAHCDLPFRRPASRGSEGDLLAAAVDVG